MNTEPFLTEVYDRVVRTIDQHECKEEDRQYDHMQKLRDESAENPGYLAHS
jgi:hypothetical protein